MVLKCVMLIELVWVEKYGKREEKPPLWQFSKGGTGTTLVLSTGTGTGTGTHCSILTSVRMLAITWSFLIRFE